ncbi:16S rRNA (guanine(966)-N(2))-methyltransferase RsmD [Eubacteriales bacterium OttesenSCG-928-N13]|nr:16S rRNA (guanine(966)-N(2))-methyltransferase RsmD [Eubacteriales bacterium OttesenSCG-928-N13]
MPLCYTYFVWNKAVYGLRIVGGEARGRKLITPDGLDTRPTADRVRESIFNILRMHVPDARVLDLFAGSGAMSLEALSRGAQHAVLVEHARRTADVIARNIETMRMQDRTQLIQADYLASMDRIRGSFDLVFLDPPYRMQDAYAKAALALMERALLAEDAVLVMEHGAKMPLQLPDAFEIYDERRYGECAVAFVRIVSNESDLSGQL